MTGAKMMTLPLGDIEFGDRFREDLGDIQDLMDSIEEQGQISPIAVERREGERYLLLAGGRRYMACMALRLDIDCRVYEELDTLDRRTIELMENVKRQDMSFQEKAKLTSEIHRLQVDKHGEHIGPHAPGHQQKDTAEMLGVTGEEVRLDIKINEAIESAPDLISSAKNRSEALRMLKRADEDKKSSDIYKAHAKRPKKKGIVDPKGGLWVSKDDLIDSYCVGDFFDGAKELEEGAFNIAEIDPPYAIDLHSQKKNQKVDMMSSYNEVERENYFQFMLKTLTETYRLLKPNSWVILWHGQEWKSTMYELLKSVGFKVTPRNLVTGIWIKPNHTGGNMQPELHLGSSWEGFFYARKGDAVMRKKGLANSFIYPAIHHNNKIHPTERPIELIYDILRTFSHGGAAGKVLCPFLGSGNTILAAQNNMAECTGFDLSEDHRNRFAQRVLDWKPSEGRMKSNFYSYPNRKEITLNLEPQSRDFELENLRGLE